MPGYLLPSPAYNAPNSATGYEAKQLVKGFLPATVSMEHLFSGLISIAHRPLLADLPKLVDIRHSPVWRHACKNLYMFEKLR